MPSGNEKESRKKAKKGPIKGKSKELTQDDVTKFLNGNKQFLSEFVLDYVEDETIEKWAIQYFRKTSHRRSSPSQWKADEEINTMRSTALIDNLIKSYQKSPADPTSSRHPTFLWELCGDLNSAVAGDFFHLYLFDSRTMLIYQYHKREIKRVLQIPEPTSLLGFVCLQRMRQVLSFDQLVKKFPQTEIDEPFAYVMSFPFVHEASGALAGVVEIYRKDPSLAFSEDDQGTASSYITWGTIALHYVDLNLEYSYHKSLHEFLLSVVKSLFQELNSVQELIKSIMGFGRAMLGAERSALFLIDEQKNELVSEVFEQPSKDDKEIRIPFGVGIAGKVAQTGKVLNIRDAYNEPSFNPEIDKITGYRTKTILCYPIQIDGKILGVVETVNKREGYFTKEDEVSVQAFATFCGLALWQARLFDKLNTSNNFLKVAVEMISYYVTCNEEDVSKLIELGVTPPLEILSSFSFDPAILSNEEMPHHIINMFYALFPNRETFNFPTMCRFVLTVAKNYRMVPYHNFRHAFTSTNTMYCILKRTQIFNFSESLALFVGILCHDLDHRGMSNKFISKQTSSPLACLYTTSPMEQHHFNQFVTILQQDGHNIFAMLDTAIYKEVLENIRHCILATDLENYIVNRAQLEEILERSGEKLNIPENRLLQSLVMTASDLSSNAKPWNGEHSPIFDEFYAEGDLIQRRAEAEDFGEEGGGGGGSSKSSGLSMSRDRRRLKEKSCLEAGFLSEICIPCYSLLDRIIPGTGELLSMAEKNLEMWNIACSEARKENSSDLGSQKE